MFLMCLSYEVRKCDRNKLRQRERGVTVTPPTSAAGRVVENGFNLLFFSDHSLVKYCSKYEGGEYDEKKTEPLTEFIAHRYVR